MSPRKGVPADLQFMKLALRLARHGYGQTSPNPMVGAVLVKSGKIIGQGWHRRAGEPHAEIEAIRNARSRGADVAGATLYVSLEPCCTYGRTGPCTDAIRHAGIKNVTVAATDPNPAHAGKGLRILKRAGIRISQGVLVEQATRLNEAFNHWIVNGTPFVTVKAAMSLDGKIATRTGESKWVTGKEARRYGMRLRQGADAILVGVNTVLADDPSLTARLVQSSKLKVKSSRLRRIILDSNARTPSASKVVTDEYAALTTIVVAKTAPQKQVAALSKRVNVWFAPARGGRIDLPWLLRKLGQECVTSLLVEGGGEMNASFLLGGFAHRVAFFYAPKIIGGRNAIKAVAGAGVQRVADAIRLKDLEYRQVGPDLLLLARVDQG
jgi:diaminohydroxyphosphoribosylaminopyrimidine deaminase/5-amino-6-(5-phosphoribosylamino)uracil reductase